MSSINRSQYTVGAALAVTYAAAFYPHSIEATKTIIVTALYLLATNYAPQLSIIQPIWYGSFAIDIYNTILKHLEVKGVCHLHHIPIGKDCDVLLKSLINLIIIDIITLGISYKLQIEVPFLSIEKAKSLHFIVALGLVVFAIYVLINYKLMS